MTSSETKKAIITLSRQQQGQRPTDRHKHNGASKPPEKDTAQNPQEPRGILRQTSNVSFQPTEAEESDDASDDSYVRPPKSSKWRRT